MNEYRHRTDKLQEKLYEEAETFANMKVDLILNHWSKEYNIIRNVYFPEAALIDLVMFKEPNILLSGGTHFHLSNEMH